MKKMLSIAIVGAMVATQLPSFDFDVNAVGTNIEVSAISVVEGKNVELKATVTYTASEQKPEPDPQPQKQYDENNVGEIYFSPVDEDHIAVSEDGLTMYADNEILVVAKPGVTKAQIEALAAKYDAEVVGYIEQTGDYQWKLKSGDPLSLLNKIENNDYCLEVGLNHIAKYGNNIINPGNEYIKLEKHSLVDPGKAEILWGHEVIKARLAWDQMEKLNISEDKYVNVGLFDSEFYDHEDLGFAQTFYNNNPPSSSHGTHVAGTMAAKGDNTEGICGIYPYGNGRLFGVSHSGINRRKENKNQWSSFMSHKIAYSELIFRNVKVINESQGFNWYNNNELIAEFGSLENLFNNVKNTYYNSAVNELKSFFNRTLQLGYDYVIVCSAGNDSSHGIHYDAKANSWLTMIEDDHDEIKYDVYDRIIVVGSIGKDLSISDFSNSGERVDIYAPGEKILSTLGSHSYDYKNCDSDLLNFIFGGFWNGTSMASPHVAGAAANVWTINNNLTGAQVKDIICRSTLNDTSISNNKGVIDVYKAVLNSLFTTGEGNTYSDNGIAMGWVFDNTDDRYNTIVSGKSEYNSETWHGVDNCTIIAYRHGTTDVVQTTTTDSDGHYELMLPAGEYDVKASHEDYGEQYINGLQYVDRPVVINSNEVVYCAWIVFNNSFTETISKIPGQNPSRTLSPRAEYAWKYYDHPNYDTSSGYDKHIIVDGDKIKMDGYLRAGYNDFMYRDDKKSSKQVLTFDIHKDDSSPKDSENEWHSMLGGGFLFNATISDDEKTISGYYVLITEKNLALYSLANVDLEQFRNNYNGSDGNKTGGKHNLLQTFEFKDRFAEHHVRIETTANSFSLYDGDEKIVDDYELPTIYGTGFGPIASHLNHDCSQRSYFTFSNISMTTM